MKLALQVMDKRKNTVSVRRHRRKMRAARNKRAKFLLNVDGKTRNEKILVPHALYFGSTDNRKSMLKFIQRMRTSSLINKSRVILDFKDCKVLNVAGVLLFVAELDRIKRILKERFSFGIENVNNRLANQLLHQVGIYKLCGITKSSLTSNNFDESVRHWRYATGERVNEQASKAFENIEGRLSPELAKGMWKSVSEAVVNSVEHAYVEPRGVEGPRMGHSRWWMFSQEREGKLTVAVCDLGIGIPRSLPLNWQPSILQKLRDSFTDSGQDSRSIRAALEVGASSTAQAHRGKGLPQIWNTLRYGKDSSISIMSNKGVLTWNGNTEEEFSKEHSTSIAGTIVVWTVPTTTADASHEG